MLAQVKEKLSTPSNTFILFNQWDRVVEDGEEQASDVREQHLSKVTRIMVDDLSIFTKEMVADRTFFVSAKQALNNADQHAGNAWQSGSTQVCPCKNRFHVYLPKIELLHIMHHLCERHQVLQEQPPFPFLLWDV